MRKLFKAVIIIIIIHSSGTISLAQSKLNQVDRMGRKTGLWLYMKDDEITRLEDYSSGVPDGLFIDFTDSGEVISYHFYDFGKLLNADSIFTDTVPPKDRINSELNNFTGVYIENSGNKKIIEMGAFKNGYAHGITRLPPFGKKEKFRMYVRLRGCGIYSIYFDQNGIPSGYQNLFRINRPIYVENWNIERNILSIIFFNPYDKKVLVPSLRSRSLSYIHITIKEKLYHLNGDTLKLNLKSEIPKYYRFIDGMMEHNKRSGRYQNVSFRNFTEIILLPHSKVHTQAKVIIPRGISINYLQIITDDEEILLDKNSFGKLPTFYDR